RKLASTPVDTEKPLLKDPDGEDVDVHTYKSMIGSLMYLTSSRPDIMFAFFACVRFQVTPKASHLHAVKRIFRYLKGAMDSELIAGLWSSVSIKKTNDMVRLQALIDRKKVIITVDTVREALQLDDTESIDCLPNEEIFRELARMRIAWNEFSSSMALTVICLTTGKRFSGVDTPLFEGMLVEQQAADDVDDVVAEDVAEPTPALPIPTTTPPPPQEHPSTSQVAPTLPPSPIAQPSSPPQQQQPSQPTTISMDLLNNLLATCTSMTRRVENLEQDKIAQALEIIKLKKWVRKLEKKKKLRVSGLKRLRKEVKVEKNDEVEMNADVQGRLKESHAKVYHIDLEHDDKVLITAATTSITAAAPITAATITAAPSAAKRRKEKSKEPLEEEESRALKRQSKSSKEKAAKKQKLDEEVEELKKHLKIIPNDEDDVYTEAPPLALKVPIVDYEIYAKHNKPYYKIIRADGTHQLFLSFLSLLRKFLIEKTWRCYGRFASSKPKNFSDDFLQITLKAMFEKLDVEDQVWKNQRGVHGLAKVKSWRLLESCGVHIIAFTTTQMFLLVERRYPLTIFTLDQMLNNVRLEVKEESKVSLELLRFVRQQQQEGYRPE
nr:hypothetical protein [Tanacetum cinerariifolium]